MTAPVGALVLAGGAGRRAAPHDKLLAHDASGRTMIARTTAEAQASRLDQVLLVLGHDAGRIRAACPGVAFVVAGDHAEGLAASLRCGISHADAAGWGAALVCLGDMPLVSSSLLDRLLEAYRGAEPPPDAVVPLCRGVRGNPVLWDRRMFPQLRALSGDKGARCLLDAPHLRSLALETDDPAVLADFDTPDRVALFARQDGSPHRRDDAASAVSAASQCRHDRLADRVPRMHPSAPTTELLEHRHGEDPP